MIQCLMLEHNDYSYKYMSLVMVCSLSPTVWLLTKSTTDSWVHWLTH